MGRPEHLDDVGAMGTWHWQACGEKRWRVRPTVGATWPDGAMQPEEDSAAWVLCEEGSIFLINTALYFHHTQIPTTRNSKSQLSVSLAREFYLPGCEGPSPATDLATWGVPETRIMQVNVCGWCHTPTGLPSSIHGTRSEPDAHAKCSCLCCSVKAKYADSFRVFWRMGKRFQAPQTAMERLEAWAVLNLNSTSQHLGKSDLAELRRLCMVVPKIRARPFRRAGFGIANITALSESAEVLFTVPSQHQLQDIGDIVKVPCPEGLQSCGVAKSHHRQLAWQV